jgi:hypothetical protein
MWTVAWTPAILSTLCSQQRRGRVLPQLLVRLFANPPCLDGTGERIGRQVGEVSICAYPRPAPRWLADRWLWAQHRNKRTLIGLAGFAVKGEHD